MENRGFFELQFGKSKKRRFEDFVWIISSIILFAKTADYQSIISQFGLQKGIIFPDPFSRFHQMDQDFIYRAIAVALFSLITVTFT